MTHSEIMARLGEVFRDVFDDDGIVLSDETTAADILAELLQQVRRPDHI